jgi:hypothetical protein
MFDGGTHNEPYANANLPLPFPDAVQEFKVETSSVPAQYGQHSAGAINVVTKSGTNDIHGDLFEFVRNKVFNARNAFASQRDGLKRNQFGGSIGGPIIKNKLFFFAGDQATVLRSVPTTVFAFVPTPRMLTGDFTAITSPACNKSGQVSLKAPFVNNKINPSQLSPAAVNLVTKWFPTPLDDCGTVTFGRKQNSNEQNIVGKLDYQQSAKNSIFGRYALARLDAPTDYDGQNWLSVSTADYTRRAHSFVLGDTYLIGPNMVSSFRGTFLYSPNPKTLKHDFFTFSDLGAKNLWYPSNWPKFAEINLTGSFSTSQVPTPGKTNTESFQFSEDLSVTKGTHQIGFGTNYIHSLMNYGSGTFTPGQMGFNGTSTGLPLADLMLGKASSWHQSQLSTQYYRQNYIGLYVQDTWKATSRLTVNGGVRYEPFIPAYDKFGPIALYDKKWFDQNIHSTVFRNAPAGILFTGDPGIASGHSLGDKQWWLRLAPRAGLSFDPKGDGLTVIKAAYGIFYDYPHMSLYSGLRDTPPRGGNIAVASTSLDDPWQALPGGNPLPLTVSPNMTFPTAGTYTIFPRNLNNTYINQWNLSVQRQVGANLLVAASYIGNNVIHMWYRHEANPAVYIPGNSCVIAGKTYTPCSSTGNTNQRRVLNLQNPDQGQYYSSLIVADADSTRNYNGFALQIQLRRSHGVTVQGNYTWSHCIDEGYADIAQANGPGTIPERRGANRGNCELDRRQNFNMSTVYETQRFSNPAVRRLATGWRVSGIARILSGPQLSVNSGLDQALSGTAGQGTNGGTPDQRPNQVLASPYAPNQSAQLWLNPAAFVQPALGTYGNVGPGSVRGPASVKFDMAVTRAFKIRESQSVEFRAEAFNLSNHVNLGNPNLVLSDVANFGRILSTAAGTTGDPRIMQLALKFVF